MIYVFLAEGFEEMEAIAPVDLLRRSDKDVLTVGVGGKIVYSSRGIPVVADIEENEIKLDEKLELIILPGGMPGTINLEKSQNVQKAIDYCMEQNIYIAAICAAPSILGHKGILEGKNAVCFPGFENQLIGANVKTDGVCADGNIITARGAGVSIEFGLKIIEILISLVESKQLGEKIICCK